MSGTADLPCVARSIASSRCRIFARSKALFLSNASFCSTIIRNAIRFSRNFLIQAHTCSLESALSGNR